MNGIDTIAKIYLNNRFALKTDNQFRQYKINVKKFLVAGINQIRLNFTSPVKFAQKKAKDFEITFLHRIPPDCTAPVQNGQCNVQFLRKIQASFSWDWGPSFPTMGIWKPIYLEYFNQSVLKDFYPNIGFDNGKF